MAIVVRHEPSAGATGAVSLGAGNRERVTRVRRDAIKQQNFETEMAFREEQARLARDHQLGMQEKQFAQQEQMFDRATERGQQNMVAQALIQDQIAQESHKRRVAQKSEELKLKSDMERQQLKKKQSEYLQKRESLMQLRGKIPARSFQAGMDQLNAQYEDVSDPAFTAAMTAMDAEAPTVEMPDGSSIPASLNDDGSINHAETNDRWHKQEMDKLKYKAEIAKIKDKERQDRIKDAERMIDKQIDAEIKQVEAAAKDDEGKSEDKSVGKSLKYSVDPVDQHNYRINRKRQLMREAMAEIDGAEEVEADIAEPVNQYEDRVGSDMAVAAGTPSGPVNQPISAEQAKADMMPRAVEGLRSKDKATRVQSMKYLYDLAKGGDENARAVLMERIRGR